MGLLTCGLFVALLVYHAFVVASSRANHEFKTQAEPHEWVIHGQVQYQTHTPRPLTSHPRSFAAPSMWTTTPAVSPAICQQRTIPLGCAVTSCDDSPLHHRSYLIASVRDIMRPLPPLQRLLITTTRTPSPRLGCMRTSWTHLGWICRA